MKVYRLASVTALLLLLPSMAEGQSSWDRYLPRSLGEVAASVEGNLAPAADPLNIGFLLLEADFPTRAQVSYAGEWRPLSPEVRELLERFIAATGLDASVLARFQEEGRFVEDGRDHWLPVQVHVREQLRELEPGSSITIFAMWVGALQHGPKLTSVFIGNSFIHSGFIREIELGAHGKITLGEVLAQRRQILGPPQGGLHPLRAGTFAGAESIAVELTNDHRVKAMHFTYALDTDFAQHLAHTVQLLGPPQNRKHLTGESGNTTLAIWQDEATIHELEHFLPVTGPPVVKLRLIDRGLARGQ